MIQTIHCQDSECKINLNTGKIELLILNHQLIIDSKPNQSVLSDGSFLMYPWVNRSTTIKEGKYYDQNKIALHGLYVGEERQIINKSQNSIEIVPKIINNNYPKFREIYEFVNNNVFRMRVIIENNKQCQYGVGFHPYFSFESLNDVIIESNINQQLLVDDKLLPIGIEQQWQECKLDKIQLKDDILFDNCFKSTNDKIYIKLIDTKKQYQLNIDSNMAYWQIYTPKDRQRIAIEAQSSSIDHFQYGTSKIGEGTYDLNITFQ